MASILFEIRSNPNQKNQDHLLRNHFRQKSHRRSKNLFYRSFFCVDLLGLDPFKREESTSESAEITLILMTEMILVIMILISDPDVDFGISSSSYDGSNHIIYSQMYHVLIINFDLL